jgi:hypothetical protein
MCVCAAEKKTENEREGESYGEIWRTLEDK